MYLIILEWDNNCQYQVFLQKYGEGDIWVKERQYGYFVVQGTPNLQFGWEIKAVQRDYTTYRLEDVETMDNIDIPEINNDYESMLQDFSNELESEVDLW